MFSSGKTCKKYLEFPANENLARIIPLQLNFMGHSRLGTWLIVVFFDVHVPPCAETWSQYSVSFWCITGIPHYHVILCPFCGVEFGSFSGWSLSIMGWAVQLHAVFMLLFSWACDCAGCAAIRSVNQTVPWLTPNKMGLIRAWSGCSVHSPIHSWNWFWLLQPWVPNLSFAHAMINQYSHHLTVQTRREIAPGRKKHLRDKNFHWETLEGWELHGGSRSFLVTHTSLGTLEDCLACWGCRMLHGVILEPRRIRLCTAYIWYVPCTPCCHCVSMWSKVLTNV